MEASDLKIKNLVLHQIDKTKGDSIVEVDGISIVDAENTKCIISYNSELGDGTAPIESFHGIELNEAWLINFGFEKVSYERVNYLDYRLNDFTVYSDLTGWKVEISGKVINLDYVHVLQNAYALIGEELTLQQV